MVSVIVPTYNGGAYIGDCLASILDQDHPELEVVVVDDGSTDGTEAVVQRFGPRVRYFRQANNGSAVARNRGLDEARGELIAFCDSDDLWIPGRLAQQVAFLQSQQHYQAVCGAFHLIDAEFPLEGIAKFSPQGAAELDPMRSGWAYHWLLRDSIYHLDALLVKRSALERVRFNPHFRRGQDFDFFLQLAQATPIAQLTAIYALYRQHGDSITRQPHLRNYRAEVIEGAIARWGLTCADGSVMTQAELDGLLAATWFSHGWDLYHARWFGEAEQAFRRSYVHKPSFGSWRYRWQSLLQRPADRMPRPAAPR